jgi:outer membrane PBP1 activator LpoA protein
MSRFNAILLIVLATAAPSAFSADPPAGTTIPSPYEDGVDPGTGLASTTVVRPLQSVPPVPDPRVPPRPAGGARPHIALILPTASPALGRLAEAVRLGFAAAAEVAGKDAMPVLATATDAEGLAMADACRASQAAGALVIVAGLTRDGAQAIAGSDCARGPVLALNELRGDGSPNVYSISLSLEHEARQAALQAVADGMHAAIVVGTASALSKRVQEAFEREWTRAAGEMHRIAYSGIPEEASTIRDRLRGLRGDMAFLALDTNEARAVRPYIPATIPVYATSMSINPRAEAMVNVDLQGMRYGEMPWFVQPDHPAVMIYPPPRVPMSVEEERLYALGIDAYRLALLIARRAAADMALDGVTGRITLDAGHAFARQLAPAEVDGGRVIPQRPQ